MINSDKKTNILLITWNYPPKIGGMEQLLYQLVQKIKDIVSVKVLAPFSEDIKSDGVTVSRSQRRGLWGYFWFAFRESSRLLNREDFNLIMGGSALVTPLVYILSKQHGIPGTIYVHGLDLIYKNPLYQFVMNALLPRLDHLFSNSNQTRKIALEKGVSIENITVIHPGIHTADYDLSENRSIIKQKYQLQGKKVLLYAGRLAKRKGVLEFVKYSLGDIISQHDDVIFCIIGDNPKTSLFHTEDILLLIEKEVKSLGLEDHVIFFGWVERQTLLEMYNACDVFLLPAIIVPGDMEGFGIVLAEANAAGRPVVSTIVGGIPDAVEQGETGILVEPSQWKEYTEAILKLLEDDSLREKYGNAGSVRAKQFFDWKVIGINYLEVVEKITNQI